MKFSDVVIATASLVLIGFLLDAVLKVAFVPLNSTTSELFAWIIAFLVASLIVGFVFALRIQDDSRIRTIGSIVVLSSFALMLFVMVWFANPLASPAIKDAMQSMFNTSGWKDYDWFAYTAVVMALNIIVFVVASFVGLYVGSMLKPKKT